MVKIRGPIYSLFAHGWLGRTQYANKGLVALPYPIALLPKHLHISQYYSHIGWCYQVRRTWHGLQPTAIKPPISAQPLTPSQEAWKSVFADAVAVWQGMSEATKDIYRNQKYPRKIAGYNRFLRQYLRDNYPPEISVGFALLQETGDDILQETGSRILLDYIFLLLETGDKLLQETGDEIIL